MGTGGSFVQPFFLKGKGVQEEPIFKFPIYFKDLLDDLDSPNISNT